MTITLAPLASSGIHRDFEADVLETMRRHGAAMHGCPITRVESKLDGSVAFWFAGPRPGVAHWEGAMKINFPLLKDKKWLYDVDAIVESALQLLAQIGAKDRQPVIQGSGVSQTGL